MVVITARTCDVADRVVCDQRANAVRTRRRVAEVAAQCRSGLDLDAPDHLDRVDDAREAVPDLLVLVYLVARYSGTDRYTPVGVVADLCQLWDVLDVDDRVEVPPVSPRLYQYVRPTCDRSCAVAVLV